MKKNFTLILLFLFNINSFSQDFLNQFDSPKREIRGVWIATVTNIDWPSVQGVNSTDIANQKNQLVNILTNHKNYGLNTIFFQVRTICDALYKSNYEPWSGYLTGTQGASPSDTSYDPLQFAIKEAHRRGMELHAWLNPYRAELQNGSPVSANHVINKHPEWIIKCNGSEYRFLNPGLPEVRQYVVKIVMDIVNQYDIDGIHFDDYFYPYSEYGSFSDDDTFSKYPNGFSDRTAWRKNNVDLLLQMINDSIKAVKPWVKFGISPSGSPSVNSTIFCNPADWLAGTYTDSTGTSHSGEPYIDYILPQLYWSRYNNLLSSWTGKSFLNGRHLYIGQAAYRFTSFPPDELTWETTTNRATSSVLGGVYFSSQSLTSNLGSCNDTLRYHYYTHPAIPPKLEWLVNGDHQPNAPSNLRFEINSSTGEYELHWDKSAPEQNGDTALAYVVYRSENNPPDIEDSTNILGTGGLNYLPANDARYSVTKGNYYAVTAINKYSNESNASNAVLFDQASLIPGKPSLTSPSNGSKEVGSAALLTWISDPNAERYIIQVSRDSSFHSDFDLLNAEYSSSQVTFRNVIPGEIYYWRIKAFGTVGESEYSDIFKFESGIPIPPKLYLPAHTSTDVSLLPNFFWFSSNSAMSYQFQLSTSVNFSENTFIIDQVVNDTSFTLTSPLEPSKIYFWRVNAKNTYGTSFWSNGFGFKTTSALSVESEAVPKEFGLEQNYPNPFNPTTIIRFSLRNSSFVKLKVYNLLGEEIKTLINEYKNKGYHDITFNATGLPSGIYIYRLITEQYSSSKKMILEK